MPSIKGMTMASPSVKPVLDYILAHKAGSSIEKIAEGLKFEPHRVAPAARFLAIKRKVACIRRPDEATYTYLPMDQVGEDYVPALRNSHARTASHAKGNGKPKHLGDGKVTGAFCLLQIAGKVIEFENMAELRNFIEAWGEQA